MLSAVAWPFLWRQSLPAILIMGLAPSLNTGGFLVYFVLGWSFLPCDPGWTCVDPTAWAGLDSFALGSQGLGVQACIT